MYLIFIISLLSLLMAFTSKISKAILPLFRAENPDVVALEKEIRKRRSELAEISMRDEYTKYVKCERATIGLESSLTIAKGRDNAKRLAYEFGLHYGMLGLFALCMLYISFAYRYSSIIVFGDNFHFEPFGRFINFPTNVPNSISVVFWIVVNNFVARTVAGYAK